MTRKDIIDPLRKNECLIDCHTHIGINTANHLKGAYPYAMTFEDLAIRMEYLGVDKSVVFSLGSSYYLRKDFSCADDTVLSAFPYEKENRELFREIYEVFPEHSEKAVPFLRFDPSVKPEEQAAQFEELNEKYPVCGLKTVTSYVESFIHDFEGKGACIRDFALKYDIPVLFHVSLCPDDIWANVFDALKVAESNPELRVCLAHCARFSKEALERAAELPNCYVDTSALVIHCQLAVSGKDTVALGAERLPADYSSPSDVLKKLAETYPDTIIWGTDTPAYTFFQTVDYGDGNLVKSELKAGFREEISVLRSLPDELVRKIAYENTLNFLSRQ